MDSYQDALKYLYDNLPMFQRIGSVAIKKDLTNTLKLCRLLANPHEAFKSVHVAGTNGKGSTAHMLASVLQSAGYKTGLYTSPHLKDFTERIKINGKPISREYVVGFVDRMRPAVEEIRPSFFEMTVCMAFTYFASENVDIAVIEVGLGGRLDSTNVITPCVSVITNIGWDHMDLLGNTLQAIAAEKAGIIKRNVPVVISERQPEVVAVFEKKAHTERAPLHIASDVYQVAASAASGHIEVLKNGTTIMSDIDLPLHGAYQHRNLPGVMATLDILNAQFSLPASAIKEGLENVVTNTGLKGRWQQLASKPTVICDTAHNVDGVRSAVEQIKGADFNRLFIIWGMVKDKDVSKVLALLPKEARYYFCQAEIPRAMDARVLQERAAAFGLHGEAIADVNEALKAAMDEAGTEDLIFIGGSTYLVAEVESL